MYKIFEKFGIGLQYSIVSTSMCDVCKPPHRPPLTSSFRSKVLFVLARLMGSVGLGYSRNVLE